MKNLAETSTYSNLNLYSDTFRNIQSLDMVSLTSCTVTDNGSGKVRITKTGGFYVIENSFMSSEAMVAFGGGGYVDGYYKIITSNPNYIDIDLDYVSNKSDVGVFFILNHNKNLGNYIISADGNQLGKYKNLKCVVSIEGVKFDSVVDWQVWLHSTGTAILIQEGQFSESKISNMSNGITCTGKILEVDVKVPIKIFNQGILFLAKSDNPLDTNTSGFIAIYDMDNTDDNGRVDVGTILGETPLSENTIAQTVAEEFKSQGIGTNVMVKPKEV